MSEYKQVIKKLIESEITGYQIYKNTLINQAIISTLRNGKRDLDNLSLKNAEKLYQYGKAHLSEQVGIFQGKKRQIILKSADAHRNITF